MKPVILFLAVLSLLLWPAAGMLQGAAPAQPVQAAAHPAAQAATPSPAPTASPPSRIPPLVGALVLLAPAVFLAWQKSRPSAAKKRTSAACLPIVDEDKPDSW